MPEPSEQQYEQAQAAANAKIEVLSTKDIRDINMRRNKAKEVVDKCVGIYLKHAIGSSIPLLRGFISRPADEVHREIANELKRHGEALQGIAVKAMQYVAMSPAHPAYREVFHSVLERTTCQSVNVQVVNDMINAAGLAGRVQLTADRPSMQGSVASIWPGVFNGSKKCAVKVLLPSVREWYMSDLGIMAELGAYVNKYKEARGAAVTLAAISEKLGRDAEGETNLELEGNNQRKLKLLLQKDAVIPSVIHCSRDLLVSEFLDKPWTTVASNFDGITMAQLKKLFEAYTAVIFKYGYILPDAHPGNLMYDDQGRIAVLDFGQCLTASDGIRNALKAVLSHPLQAIDDKVAAQLLQSLGFGNGDPKVTNRAVFDRFFCGGTTTQLFIDVPSVAETFPLLIMCQYLSSLGARKGQPTLFFETMRAAAMA